MICRMNEVWLRRLRRLEELPGPVWVFGAYVVARAARWAFERSVMLVKGSLDWQTLWVEGLVLLGVLLPVAVLWLLVSGSSRALSLARWYAGLRAVLHFVSLLYPLVVGYGPETVSEVGHEFLARGLVSVAVGCGLWFVFLLYLERSSRLRAVLPAGQRPAPWWAVAVLLCVLPFVG